MPVTILELAEYRGAQKDERGGINGGEFARVGLAILGGCEHCGATLGAYNGYPSRSGYWRCADCICDDGWESVAEASFDIFESAQDAGEELDERDLDPYYQSDVPPAWFDPSYAGERWSDDY